MAFYDDLRNFMENRLRAFDPTIDLTEGSPAQVEIIEALITRLGTNPFDIDIADFVVQRLTESYPKLAADHSVLEDMFVKPLIALLAPFKDEMEAIKLAQSIRNAELLSDDEVDALAANFFVERKQGSFSSGSARIYFNAPQASQATITKRFSTTDGLNFYPVTNTSITAGTMIFNREGNLYYMDVNVQAEAAGESYNITAGELTSVDDMPGVVKVTNLNAFGGGVPREDNATFAARIEQSLTERSLVTKRGVVARLNDLYSNIKAIQVIGAGEVGMNRDILTGTGQGFLHVVGTAKLFGTWVFITGVTYKDTGPKLDITIGTGDTFRWHRPINVDPNRVVNEAKIVRVLWSGTNDRFIFEVDKDLGTVSNFNVNMAILKPGFISISGIPGGMLETTAPDNKIHLGGHSDIYVSPTNDQRLSATVKNVADNSPVLALLTGIVTAGSNDFSTVAPDPVDLAAAGVQRGDTIVIETGAQVGTYTVLEAGATLKLDTVFTVNEGGLRARVVRNVTTNLNEFRTPKLPFNTAVNDLNTIIGSNLFTLNVNNLQSFGVVVGDIIELLDGPDAGRFTIIGFDNVLGGLGPLVDRPAGSTGNLLRYKVYSAQTGLEFPLVRIKNIELLDSSNQTTGITIPYGDAVDIRAMCDFDSEGETFTVLDPKLFIMPDTLTYWDVLANQFAVPAANVDARYTQQLVSFDGKVRVFPANGGNPIINMEVNLPPFTFDGRKNTLLAFTTMEDNNFTFSPSFTSHLADAKIGDSVTLLNGANAGTYLIEDIRVLELWGRSGVGHFKVAVIQVDGQFKADPVRTSIDFIARGAVDGSGVVPITNLDLLKMVEFATDWSNNAGFYEGILIPKLLATLTFYGFASNTNEVRSILNSMAMTGYSIGPSPRGNLRLYFQEPVSVELYSGFDSTKFSKIEEPLKKCRLSMEIKQGQILPEAEIESPPSDWLRDASAKHPIDTNLFTVAGASFAARGVETGQTFEFHPAINDLDSRFKMNSSIMCRTQAGSNVVDVMVVTSILNVTPLAPGQLLFIDTGPDAGMYTVTKVRGPLTVEVDRVMTHTTLAPPFSSTDIVNQGGPGPVMSFTPSTVTAGNKLINDVTFPAALEGGGLPGFPESWLMVYAADSNTIQTAGDDVEFLGVYKVTGSGAGFAVVDRTVNWPSNANIFWIRVPKPATAPAATSGGGTQITNQFVRGRMYSGVTQKRTISINWGATPNPLISIDANSAAQNQMQVSAAIATAGHSHKSPYRILGKNVKKISSTRMKQNFDKGLYYFDVPVISIGVGQEFHFPRNTAFALDGKYFVEGYTLSVSDQNLTYSVKEVADIILPNAVLPVGSTPGKNNKVKIAGQNLQFNYDNAELIEELQRFFDSPLDRVVCDNPLVRHFLPSYPIIDIHYFGGSTEDVIAQDIIDFINSIPAEDNQIRIDALVKLCQRRGARSITMPLEVVSLTHGLDRRIKSIRSENSVGIDFPVFKGVNKMVYFIPGPNVSKELIRPIGEQIYLKRN